MTRLANQSWLRNYLENAKGFSQHLDKLVIDTVIPLYLNVPISRIRAVFVLAAIIAALPTALALTFSLFSRAHGKTDGGRQSSTPFRRLLRHLDHVHHFSVGARAAQI